jgi:fructose-specific phosphotransferase system IIC component
MKIVTPFFAWVSPHHLLAALFAAIGVGGVLAALLAFEKLVPHRDVFVSRLIYASSVSGISQALRNRRS